MEQVIANGRVPKAKKEASIPILNDLGATTSDLINAAYDYLLAEKKLPCASQTARLSKTAFKEFLGASTLDVDWTGYENATYKEMLAAELAADYERLA